MSRFNLPIPDEFEMRIYTLTHDHGWKLTSKFWVTILEIASHHYSNQTFVRWRKDIPSIFEGAAGVIEEKWDTLEHLEFMYNWFKDLEKEHNWEVKDHE